MIIEKCCMCGIVYPDAKKLYDHHISVTAYSVEDPLPLDPICSFCIDKYIQDKIDDGYAVFNPEKVNRSHVDTIKKAKRSLNKKVEALHDKISQQAIPIEEQMQRMEALVIQWEEENQGKYRL